MTEKGWPTVHLLVTATEVELLNTGGEVRGDLVAGGVVPTPPASIGATTPGQVDASCTTARRLPPGGTIEMRLLEDSTVPAGVDHITAAAAEIK